jgi:hypothetical protein
MIPLGQIVAIFGLLVGSVIVVSWIFYRAMKRGSRLAHAALFFLVMILAVALAIEDPSQANRWMILLPLGLVGLLAVIFERHLDKAVSAVYQRTLKDKNADVRLKTAYRHWESHFNSQLEMARKDIAHYVASRVAAVSDLSWAERIAGRRLQLVLLSIVTGLHVAYLVGLHSNTMEVLRYGAIDVTWIVLVSAISRISPFDYGLVLASSNRMYTYLGLLWKSWLILFAVAVVAMVFDLVRLPIIIVGACAVAVAVLFLVEPALMWSRTLRKIPRPLRIQTAQSLVFYLFVPFTAFALVTTTLFLLLPYIQSPRWVFAPFWEAGPIYAPARLEDLSYLLFFVEMVFCYFLFLELPYWRTTKLEIERSIRPIKQEKAALLSELSSQEGAQLDKVARLLLLDSTIQELGDTPTHVFGGFNFIIVQLLLGIVAGVAAQFLLVIRILP